MEKKSKKKFASFEEDLKSMQEILDDLESDSLTLEEMIQKYRKGVELAKSCKKKLQKAETEIKKISK